VTARRRPRTRSDRIPFAELDRLVRERSYLRPLAAVPSLHQMARRRIVPASTDSRAGGNTTTERNQS
jgi:hypothetical protein